MRHPVDEYRPFSKLVLFGVQHVLVMAATPISSVFLVSKTLHLSGELSEKLLAAAFVLSGIGTLLQSLGRGRRAGDCRSSCCPAALRWSCSWPSPRNRGCPPRRVW